ncbi:MAG: DNA-processing protein DprA [Candidatus Kapaibacteriales bacterium]
MVIYKDWSLRHIVELLLIPGLGYKAQKAALDRYDSLPELKEKPKGRGVDFSKILNESLFESIDQSYISHEIKQMQKHDIEILGHWENSFPQLLKKDNSSPAFLFSIGEIKTDPLKSISIVGTRRNSSYGKYATEKFVDSFVRNGISIISGMAQGIDSIAHKHTIGLGGHTIAVLGSGLASINPSYSAAFAENIIEKGGGLISSYLPSTKARPQFFVQRNRIISGMSRATLIVESKAKGGSLWTAKFANEQGREVFAIPGKINSEKSEGTHQLIVDNIAQLATSPEYILKEFNLLNDNLAVAESAENDKLKKLTATELTTYKILEADPMDMDVLINKLNFIDPNIGTNVHASLLSLEFAGLIKQMPGGKYMKL